MALGNLLPCMCRDNGGHAWHFMAVNKKGADQAVRCQS